MSDFKTAFGYNIGIIDLKTLLTIAVTIVYDEKTFRFLYKGIIINHNKNRANLH